jgi:glycosyltransferase involved in cell wall biosynthesis
MPAMLERAPDAHLAVVGRGPYESQLRKLASRLRVEHAVTFDSFDSSERGALGALINSSDVVALLSDYEANPIAVMEALALGRNVVVADTSGMTELAAQGLATAVPLDIRAAALAEVLITTAAAPSRSGLELPTWDQCVDKLLDLYAQVA